MHGCVEAEIKVSGLKPQDKEERSLQTHQYHWVGVPCRLNGPGKWRNTNMLTSTAHTAVTQGGGNAQKRQDLAKVFRVWRTEMAKWEV